MSHPLANVAHLKPRLEYCCFCGNRVKNAPARYGRLKGVSEAVCGGCVKTAVKLERQMAERRIRLAD